MGEIQMNWDKKISPPTILGIDGDIVYSIVCYMYFVLSYKCVEIFFQIVVCLDCVDVLGAYLSYTFR